MRVNKVIFGGYGKEQDLCKLIQIFRKILLQSSNRKVIPITLYIQAKSQIHHQLLKCNSLADLLLLGRNKKKEQNQQ